MSGKLNNKKNKDTEQRVDKNDEQQQDPSRNLFNVGSPKTPKAKSPQNKNKKKTKTKKMEPLLR